MYDSGSDDEREEDAGQDNLRSQIKKQKDRLKTREAAADKKGKGKRREKPHSAFMEELSARVATQRDAVYGYVPGAPVPMAPAPVIMQPYIAPGAPQPVYADPATLNQMNQNNQMAQMPVAQPAQQEAQPNGQEEEDDGPVLPVSQRPVSETKRTLFNAPKYDDFDDSKSAIYAVPQKRGTGST